MTIEELLNKINEIVEEKSCPSEDSHYDLDMLLLEYIGDERITKAFNDIDKWYA